MDEVQAKQQGGAPRRRTRCSTLDALLLTPLAASFLLPPLGLLVWGLAHLAERYVATVRAPAAPMAWWQWPWGWPGPRMAEALHTALGGSPLSGLSPWGSWHPADSFEVVSRALTAVAIDGLVALLPLVLVSWTAAAVLAVVRDRVKARRLS